jgi:hypothetical protein
MKSILHKQPWTVKLFFLDSQGSLRPVSCDFFRIGGPVPSHRPLLQQNSTIHNQYQTLYNQGHPAFLPEPDKAQLNALISSPGKLQQLFRLHLTIRLLDLCDGAGLDVDWHESHVEECMQSLHHLLYSYPNDTLPLHPKKQWPLIAVERRQQIQKTIRAMLRQDPALLHYTNHDSSASVEDEMQEMMEYFQRPTTTVFFSDLLEEGQKAEAMVRLWECRRLWLRPGWQSVAWIVGEAFQPAHNGFLHIPYNFDEAGNFC